MNPNFSIERKRVRGVDVLAINGRIDGVTCDLFNKELSKLLLEGAENALCDFSNVNYLSSAGIRVLLVNYKEFLNIKKSMVFFGLQEPIRNILKLAGLLKHLTVFENFDHFMRSRESVLSEAAELPPEAAFEGIKYRVKALSASPGVVETFGDSHKYRTSTFEEKDVLTVPIDKYPYALGLGCLGGENYTDYKGRFGEAVVIKNNFFYYPAMSNSMVDYLIPQESISGEGLKYFFGAGLNGGFSKIIECQALNSEFSTAGFLDLLFKISEMNLLGLVFIMETSVTEGIHIKKVPTRENRENENDIFAPENVYDYFEYQLEPEKSKEIVIGVGLALRDKAKPVENCSSLIPAGLNFHIHALSFERRPFNASLDHMDSEIKRFIDHHEPRKVFHMQAGTAFKKGVAGIINLQP